MRKSVREIDLCVLDDADPGVRNREGNNIHLYALGRGFLQYNLHIAGIMYPSAIPSYEPHDPESLSCWQTKNNSRDGLVLAEGDVPRTRPFIEEIGRSASPIRVKFAA